MNDPTEIQDAAVRYFSNLFHPSPSVMDGSLFDIEGPTVMTEQNSILASLPTEEEIKWAVFSLKRSSSPSLDEFSGSFFPVSWPMNAYLNALIPNVSPSYFEFRHIGILIFSYKIITKILVDRLSTLLPPSIFVN